MKILPSELEELGVLSGPEVALTSFVPCYKEFVFDNYTKCKKKKKSIFYYYREILFINIKQDERYYTIFTYLRGYLLPVSTLRQSDLSH